jgi:hypothetical protein
MIEDPSSDLSERLDLLDFAYRDLKLNGSALTREGVATILDGGLVPQTSIAEHDEIRCHEKVLTIFQDMLYMQTDLDRAGLSVLAEAWRPVANVNFRTNNPLLHHLGFIPPYHGDIPRLIDALFVDVRTRLSGAGVIARASRIHNGLMYIYPFDAHTGTIARAAMQYELRRGGLPIVDIGMTEEAYNDLVAASVRKRSDEEMISVIETALEVKRDSC